MAQIGPTLLSNRAFVVQFRATKRNAHVPPSGRVEDLISGQAAHFRSWEHLRRFVEQILAEIQAEPP